jgi:hypothetical protein
MTAVGVGSWIDALAITHDPIRTTPPVVVGESACLLPSSDVHGATMRAAFHRVSNVAVLTRRCGCEAREEASSIPYDRGVACHLVQIPWAESRDRSFETGSEVLDPIRRFQE